MIDSFIIIHRKGIVITLTDLVLIIFFLSFRVCELSVQNLEIQNPRPVSFKGKYCNIMYVVYKKK